MIDPQEVARLIAWCEARTDDPQIREIAAALRNMQDERLDVLAALHLPDHGPVDPVEKIRTILRNWDEAEDRAATAGLKRGPVSDDAQEIRLGPVSRHPDVCHGALVINGSRVYVDSFFSYLAAGQRVDEWLEDYPSISREQAVETLELAYRTLEVATVRPTGPPTIAEWEADVQRAYDSMQDPEWGAAPQEAFNAPVRVGSRMTNRPPDCRDSEDHRTRRTEGPAAAPGRRN